MTITANRQTIAAELAAVLGETFPVTTDPRNVNPPCVLVAAGDGFAPAPCGWSGVVPVWLLVPGPANLDALETAEQMLDLVRAARVTIASPARNDIYMTDPAGDTGLFGYVFDVLLTS